MKGHGVHDSVSRTSARAAQLGAQVVTTTVESGKLGFESELPKTGASMMPIVEKAQDDMRKSALAPPRKGDPAGRHSCHRRRPTNVRCCNPVDRERLAPRHEAGPQDDLAHEPSLTSRCPDPHSLPKASTGATRGRSNCSADTTPSDSRTAQQAERIQPGRPQGPVLARPRILASASTLAGPLSGPSG